MALMHKMTECGSILRNLAGAGLAAALLAGCGVGGIGGGTSTSSSQLAASNASNDDIIAGSSSALPVIARECPPIRVSEGGESLAVYAQGREGQARGLVYQAVIDEQSRNCVVSDGLITVQMGVLGRVLAGPAGTAGSVTIPVRFSVVRDDLTVFEQTYQVPTDIMAGSMSGDLIQVVDNIDVPYIGGDRITFWVGFEKQS